MATIENIIKTDSFFHSYQPVKCLKNNRLIGVESLIRCEAYDPMRLFQQARKANLLFELDTKSIMKSIETFQSSHLVAAGCKLFVNIFPSTLLHEGFDEFVNQVKETAAGIIGQIVFEINESAEEHALWDELKAKGVIPNLQKEGFFIALDDFGEGSISFRHLFDYDPNYIKLSRTVTAHIEEFEKKRKLVDLLVKYCEDHTKLILEGIEKESELAVVKQLGVELGQGYLLDKPKSIAEIERP
ncbi:EAL domain-containing protein [Brevibacillus sp. SYP-B805]|uniref:EAL domain-containing protein n=1 Tax=Brevibacillus sp. SYP-B805 TaxID=1578199 RepID=UPI0013ECFDE7|nr:EAL domain-containing protein [Brevibacillus sp. SYP-B805]NGQ95126.1 EAL domain-containing protein [Brevibacillus sp. SYP-B805]